MIKKLLWSLLFLAIIYSGVQADTPSNNKNSLADLIEEALQNNPSLQAAGYKTSASRAQTPQMTAWEPPQFGIEFYKTPVKSFPNPIVNGMETDYFVQQIIPIPGKRSAMGNAAASNSLMQEQNYRILKNKLIRDLKTAYFDLYLQNRKIEINAESENLLRQLADNAAHQYQVGFGNQAVLFRAQTELARSLTQQQNLQNDKKNAKAVLNTLLNRPIDSPFTDDFEITTTEISFSFDRLAQLALTNRPELQAMQSFVEMQKAELLLSKREYYPDLMMRIMYKDMKMTDDDFWSMMIGFEVPEAFWSAGKLKHKVEENKYKVMNSEQEYIDMKNMITLQVQQVWLNVQNAFNLLQNYKNNVLPNAEQTLYAAQAQYQTGGAELMILLETYQLVLDSKQEYFTAVRDYNVGLAQLEEATGMALTEIENNSQ